MAKITLNWTESTGPVKSYNIYRSTSEFDSTDFQSYATLIGSVASSSTEYIDEDLTIEYEYYYYGVAAVDAKGLEVLSEVVEVGMLSAPTDLTAVFSVD